MNLNDGQIVYVTLDERTFAQDGNFYLKNSENERICVVLTRLGAHSESQDVVRAGDVVERFGNSSTSPIEYGVINPAVVWADVDAVSPGQYTGTIYFKIGIENE